MFTSKLKIVEWRNTGIACPSQWEAQALSDDGCLYDLYIRYRSRRFTVHVESTTDENFKANLATMKIPPFLVITYFPASVVEQESQLSDAEMKHFTEHLLEFPHLTDAELDKQDKELSKYLDNDTGPTFV
jgi:hypothetical protein